MRHADRPVSVARHPTLLALALPAILVAPPMAAAHFVLRSPASWRDQGPLGDPQKVGPCGDEGGAATTGVVTAFSPGETITITLDEIIFHPGHYRVALAVSDRSELPPAPVVTPGDSPCGSVPIEESPAFPVLADGLLRHTAPFSGTQSIQVTLPTDVTCTRCTLQVLEFMSSHGVPCFYHHCADISIGAGTAKSCTGDADCADDVVCTNDRCDPDTATCVTEPMTLANVAAGFLGSLQVDPCSTERVPARIGALFGKADALVVRAAGAPTKAQRLLGRASRKLRGAARKAAKASDRRISPACREALGAALDEAKARVGCLLTD